MATGAAAADRGALAPVRRLTVLYDPNCPLCAFVRDWLAGQRQLVPLDLVPVGSAEAHRRFPGFDHSSAEREITVIGDGGQVYRASAAWVVCLWALAEYRPLSHRLSTPAGAPLARAAVLAAAKYREAANRGGNRAVAGGAARDPRRGGPPGGWAPIVDRDGSTGVRTNGQHVGCTDDRTSGCGTDGRTAPAPHRPH
ncbi:thiol-disulfide oxidoreductase DCC family protein [Streptomyces sp. H27-D2]|uniref:thiol-disulfide oxidoreductase DCC family protein n=1 Tax=Streptomyces sp. H27-D2 TaxID=3046304 RepID=UPI002DBF9512|nr:DCC1-like thiol-disulfide oxidoreductase family protein [Streptomyces sp. H27-D2]MEC4015952.1 DCC1-like thiol-disulfide oxidoreductase family protein [Streptomyces sp. H27-D2]